MLRSMLLCFLYLSTLFTSCTPYNPPCTSCRWFIPHQRENNDYGLCGFYKNVYIVKGAEKIVYEFASHCRNNETMCGERGFMYEPAEKIREYRNKYEELANRCCGEVNESDEIEQLEREMLELMQKIKKHNTRNIYRTTKDLYKLFRRDQV